MAEKAKKTWVQCIACGGFFWMSDPRTIHFDPQVYYKGCETAHFCCYCTQNIKLALDAQGKE